MYHFVVISNLISYALRQLLTFCIPCIPIPTQWNYFSKVLSGSGKLSCIFACFLPSCSPSIACFLQSLAKAEACTVKSTALGDYTLPSAPDIYHQSKSDPKPNVRFCQSSPSLYVFDDCRTLIPHFKSRQGQS